MTFIFGQKGYLPMPVAENQNIERSPTSHDMLQNAQRTTDFLKSIAHTGRLMILCRLAEGPATVSELEQMLDMRQSAVSKQLARLRHEGMVDFQRDGRSIYYELSDERARQIVNKLYDLFCN